MYLLNNGCNSSILNTLKNFKLRVRLFIFIDNQKKSEKERNSKVSFKTN